MNGSDRLMGAREWWSAVARGRVRPSGVGAALEGCLVVLSVLYGMGSAVSLWVRSARPARAGVPVISVGNLVVGGTGKTPLVVHIARLLADGGRRVAVVSRGHGRRSRGVLVVSRGDGPIVPWTEAGDEPYLIALLTKGVPVLVAARRADAARAAVADWGADAILLDDGFQHTALARDLDIVAVDAGFPLGNGHALPAGALREHPLGIGRADLIVATRCDRARGGAGLVARTLGPLAPRAPIVETRMAPSELWDVRSGATVAAGELRGTPALALCGIADPEGFAATARDAGLSVVGEMVYPDHHAYRSSDLAAVAERAREIGAGVIVTTEKDAVRLSGWSPPARLIALGIELEVTRGRALLTEAIEKALRWGDAHG
ncbi:MAG: tetraacyldisaccharide 4'-kinase [Candidatus Eisenbacteria bacterium]|nr:tetraacyldisaccharide 4'-kinase [Candidatus Eisenbacteria bacterium]